MRWRWRPKREEPHHDEPQQREEEPGFERGPAGEPRYVGPPAQSGYGPYWRGEPGGRDRGRFSDLPDPSRGIRPEGPGGFYWEGLGFEPASQHRGRGPKGYRRPDARIAEEVCERLTEDHHVDASAIDVVVEDGVVHLRGTVADRPQKRRAERVAERARGVVDVMNELRIARERPAARAAGPVHSSNGGGRHR